MAKHNLRKERLILAHGSRMQAITVGKASRYNLLSSQVMGDRGRELVKLIWLFSFSIYCHLGHQPKKWCIAKACLGNASGSVS